jgi:hypothetical protein
MDGQNKRAAGNKGFAIAGVPCFADTVVQGGSSVLRIKFSAKTPCHRKPPKRYHQYYLLCRLADV